MSDFSIGRSIAITLDFAATRSHNGALPPRYPGPRDYLTHRSAPMSNKYTYANPYLSLWQSAAEDVQRKRASVRNRLKMMTSVAALPAATDVFMSPVDTLGVPLSAGQNERVERMFVPPARAHLDLAAVGQVLHTAEDCAKVAAEFLWDEIKGDQKQADVLAGELKDSECDPGWSECLAAYVAYKLLRDKPVYRANRNPVFPLDSNTRLAIVGDWGTGGEVATNLLQQVKKFSPDVLLHLGDVYYAGTQYEQQTNFLDICRNVLGNSVRLFSMCGNHDMYSGGSGYYWLVDQLGQQASYFCLQNANWQFLAMDTGHNDNDPLTVATNMTSLVTDGAWHEENWLLDKINLAGTKKNILLSHHQLFSPFGSVGSANGKPYAYNPNLRASFQAVMQKIAWWFWGHEHTLAIFDPYMNLQRGRCVGASAVPVFTDQQSYSNAAGLQTYGGAALPKWNASGQLGNNGQSYNNCFALMTLNGASANVDYYQVPLLGTAVRLPVSDQA